MSLSSILRVVLVFVISSATAYAQLGFESGESSLDIDNPHPTLFSGSKVDGYDYLEATLDVEAKSAAVSWAPFFTSTNYGVLSEMRLRLAQKDSVTSLGFSFKYNPFNPRSTQAESVFTNMTEPKPRDANGLLAARVRRVIGVDAQIRNVLAAGSAECAKTPNEILRIADDYQQVVKNDDPEVSDELAGRIRCSMAYASSFLMEAETNIKCLEDKLNQLRQTDSSDGGYTYRCYAIDGSYEDGASIPVTEETLDEFKTRLKTWKNHFSRIEPAATRIYYDEHVQHAGATALVQLQSERASLIATIDSENVKDAETRYLDFRKKLYKSAVPIVTASYVTSFFEVLGGDDIDANNNMMNDNEHRVKGRVASLAADWRLGEENQLSLIVTRSNERGSPEAGTPDADYNGVGVTYSRRLLILNEDGYAKSKDYKESLFVPSINIGVAYERKDCESPDADCADGILRSQAITLFVDFKINKKAQFRLGVPFKRTRLFMAGTDGEEDSVEFQAIIAFQLGAPK